MADKTCGDYGGRTSRGTPCKAAAGRGTDRNVGLCSTHSRHEAGEVLAPAVKQMLEDETDSFRDVAHPKKRAFLRAYARAGTITRAAATAQCSTRMVMYWLDPRHTAYDHEFEAAFEHAKKDWADLVLASVYQLGLEGELVFDEEGHPVTFLDPRDGKVKPRFRRNVTALMAAANHAVPGFRPASRHEVSGPGGGPIQVEVYAAEARDYVRERLRRLRESAEVVESYVESDNGRPSSNGRKLPPSKEDE